jgi:hypothetical protein
MLSEKERMRICASVKNGAKFLVGRDHTGRQKIKLVKGPFGLFVERFECTEIDLMQIRNMLAGKDSSAAA